MSYTQQPPFRFDARETLAGELTNLTVRQAVEGDA